MNGQRRSSGRPGRRLRSRAPGARVAGGLAARFPTSTLDELACYLDVIHVTAGETLVRSGDAARQYVEVVDGEVEIVDDQGAVTVAGPGAEIGARELESALPHTATVRARTACTLAVVFGPAYRSAWRQSGAAVAA